MTSKSDIVKPKTVKVYELEAFEKLLKGIKVAACMLTESQPVVDEASVLKRLNTLTINGASDGNCCSCCGVGPFKTRADQTTHYKHHWHTYNLKRKLFGKSALTFGQFNSRLDDDSSVSGSDSETDDSKGSTLSDLFAAATRHCKAFFSNHKGQVFCVYRCILHHRKEILSTDGEGHAWVERCQRLTIPAYQRWAVLMVSGGHFAGAVFATGAPVVHKTLHSYLVRRGQGQAQGTRDQYGSAPRSAGASLRRYNQAQFLEHVQEILNGWTEHLKDCSHIFYRAVGSANQAAIFGKNSPLTRDDPRVRALPFPTRKPTYKEVLRAHETIASLEVYESIELFQKALMASRAASKTSSDTSLGNQKRLNKSSPNKPVDRAKSRERAPRELPTQLISSEDEGPCFIDSETPVGWIKTLSEQSSKGIITNSRKDLLNDCSVASSGKSDTETESLAERREIARKKKKKKQDEKKDDKNASVKKMLQKIPANVKKIWKAISSNEGPTLETIFEGLESGELEAACNTQDPSDGNTALHKAAIAAKPDLVTRILCAGGDPCVRNHQLQTPYAAAPHQDTRVAFRLFQAQFPDKYNYAKSHIPGPLTPELLEQEREKKAQQKRAKRQRDKEKQLEKIKTNKFMQLSDTEKAKTLEPRCFLCAERLPRVPFEYEEYRFCSIRCLQNHRNMRPLHMTA